MFTFPLVKGPFGWEVPFFCDAGGTRAGGSGFKRSGSSGAVSSMVPSGMTLGSLFLSALTPACLSNTPVGAGLAARCAFSCSYFSPVLRSPMRMCRQS